MYICMYLFMLIVIVPCMWCVCLCVCTADTLLPSLYWSSASDHVGTTGEHAQSPGQSTAAACLPPGLPPLLPHLNPAT